MLHLSTVDAQTLELLRKLQQLPILRHTRLVGGTALALQIGHRKSIDLDFFGLIEASSQELIEALRALGNLIILKDSTNIHIYILNGVKIDIVNYNYPWIDEAIESDDIRMASLKDIAAMKVTAVVGRGTKKDFIDIRFLLQDLSLEQLLGFYSQKYPEASPFMALKSLAYFEDAEEEMMPYMFSELTWEEVKSNILTILSL